MRNGTLVDAKFSDILKGDKFKLFDDEKPVKVPFDEEYFVANSNPCMENGVLKVDI